MGSSIHKVAAELRLDPAGAAGELAAMARAGLIEVIQVDGDTIYAYLPRTEELRRVVDELAAAYAQRPTTLISLIYAAPAEPPPDDKMKSFADAFNVRKP